MKWSDRGIYLVIILFFAGCSSPVTSTTNTVPDATPFPPLPTTLQPTTTLFPTQTHTPIPPTITLLPVMRQPEEIKKELFELLLNNGGCQLPCLFGYMPGVVSQEEIRSFFNQFELLETQEMLVRRATYGNSNGITFYFPYIKGRYLDMHVAAYKHGNQVEALVMDVASRPNWDIRYTELTEYYLLPQIFTNYGIPPQILVATYRNDIQSPDITAWPFFLTIIYPEQGIYVKYEMSRQISGDGFIGCPSKSFVSVATWIPDNNEAFGKVIQVMNNGGDLSSYKSIDTATAMTPNEFYETFSDPKNEKCIETPIEVWPST